MSSRLDVDEIKKAIKVLLDATHNLAESHPSADENKHFIRVLEGAYRRSTFTLLSIRYIV
jgi:hypothetical protein